MIALSPQIQFPEGSDPGQVETPKDVKQNGLGVFAKLLAGLIGKEKASGGTGAELPGEALETEAVVEEAASPTGKTGAAKKATPRDAPGISLSAEPEKTQKKTPPKPAVSAGSEEDRTIIAALQGVVSGEIPRETPEAAEGEGVSPEEIPFPQVLSGTELRENAEDGAVPFPNPEGPVKAAAGETKPPSREGGIEADGSGDPADRILETGIGSSRVSQGATPVSPGRQDKESLSEARNGKKDRERLSLEVRDFRSGEEELPRINREDRAAGESAERDAVELTVELRSGGKTAGKQSPAGEGRSSQLFTDMLARELNQNLAGDIVRHASIMLRDGGAGTIRLSLKPESLGTVKIRLEMAENKIAGQIIVESDEALRAFEREIRSLEQAFRDSGFEGASLKMALTGEGGQNGAAGQWKGEEARPFFSPRLAASGYEASGETAESDTLFDGSAAGRIGGGARVLPQVNMLI